MEYRKEFIDGDNIPDFALQPAKPASTFDPTVYDKLFESMNQADKKEKPAEPVPASTDIPLTEPVNADNQMPEPLEAEPVIAEVPEELSRLEATTAEISEAEPVNVDAEMAEQLEAKPTIEEMPEKLLQVKKANAEISKADPVDVDAQKPEPLEAKSVVAELPEELPQAEETTAELVETESTSAEMINQEPHQDPVIEQASSALHKGPTAPTPATLVHLPQKPLPIHSETALDSQRKKKIAYTDFHKPSPVTVYVEEDVLITDTKPDMVQMLDVCGSCQLAERSISTDAHGVQSARITGDLKVQALYTAENDEEEPLVVSLDTKILFREDCTVKGDPNSTIYLNANLQSIEWDRINERKFRVRAVIEINMREYCEKQLELFDGMEQEELQFLRDEMQFTDIAMRKTEIVEVSEEIMLREGVPEIDKILCFQVNLVENHKQVTGEKAMINATAYLNLLYRSDGCPEFYRCKTEFTQFMRVDQNGFEYPLLAGRVFFNILDCSLSVKRDDEGYGYILCLDMDVETTLEYYRQVQEPCVVDMYHYSKDVEYDRVPREFKCFCGSGTTDIPVREIVDIPERYGKAEQVIFISGSPKIKNQKGFQGKVMVEGILPVRLTCIGGESGKLPFSIEQEIDFRASLDIPASKEQIELDSHAVVKELWFDQINDRQIAVNAEITVSGYAFEKSASELIENVSLLERNEDKGPKPSIIVYAAKEGDTVWKVAKKYHAPVSRVRAVNDLLDHEEISTGAKILIVR